MLRLGYWKQLLELRGSRHDMVQLTFIAALAMAWFGLQIVL